MILSNFKKKLITFIFLIYLIFLIFNYNFIFAYTLIVTKLSVIEFNQITKKLNLEKIFNFSFYYLHFLFFVRCFYFFSNLN